MGYGLRGKALLNKRAHKGAGIFKTAPNVVELAVIPQET